MLASHYGRQKDASALRELEEGIISRQVAETPRLLAALTCAYARAGDFVAALRSYVHCISCLHLITVLSRYDSAMQLPSVDEGLHPPLLIHLARAGRLEEMERVFNDVPTSRYTRLEAVVMAMMNAFKAAGKNEKMTELQQRLQQVLAPQSAQKQTKPPPRH